MNITPLMPVVNIKSTSAKAPSFKERTVQDEMLELLNTISDLYGRDSEQYARILSEYNRRYPNRPFPQQSASDETRYEQMPPGYTYNNIVEQYNSDGIRRNSTEMTYADRMAFLDRLNRFDYFGSLIDDTNIAPELMRQLDEIDYEDTYYKVNYFRSQGRRLIEALGGNYLIQLKDNEILPEMKINGFDYYVTLGGLLMVDSKRYPKYKIIDDNDIGQDFYEPMFDDKPRYLWVNGIGKVDMRKYDDLEICKDIRSTQTTYYYSDENRYFRMLDQYRQENCLLKKDVNGIYYTQIPQRSLPSNLQGRSIYINLWDGSLHTNNSEAFSGITTPPLNQNTQTQNERTTDMNSVSDDIQSTNTVAEIVTPNPPPYKIDRMELALTSSDPRVKSAALDDIIDYVNSNSFDPNFKDYLGRNVIHLSMLGRDEKIKSVIAGALAKGVDINAGNMVGLTPLMMAIKNLITANDDNERFADLSVIKFILDKNPDIDAQDKNKQTAFHLACMSTSVALLTLMLSKNPNILIKDVKGKRAADYLKTDELKELYKKHVL